MVHGMLSIRPIMVDAVDSLPCQYLNLCPGMLSALVGGLSLQETVLSPFTTELPGNERKVWYPQQAAHKVRPRDVEE